MSVNSENKQSIKVLDELLSKLNISKSQDEVNGASLEIATFINGDIEEQDAPTKYVATTMSERIFASLY